MLDESYEKSVLKNAGGWSYFVHGKQTPFDFFRLVIVSNLMSNISKDWKLSWFYSPVKDNQNILFSKGFPNEVHQ